MKLTELRPMLWTHKFQESIDFYTQILEFTCNERNDNWHWASLSKDNVYIMIAGPNDHMPFEKTIFTGSFYFNTDDVEKLWEQLKNKTKICYEIETFDWGMREFAIYDNNEYILQFGQNIENPAKSP